MKYMLISLNAFAAACTDRRQIRADEIGPVIPYEAEVDFVLGWILRILLLALLLLPVFLVIRYFRRKKKNQQDRGGISSDKKDE